MRDFSDWQGKIQTCEQEFCARKKSGNGVSLSTLHKAKGLEWDTVCMIDAADGTNPCRSSRFDRNVNLEEERRLFYVAMTRARHRLVISSCQWAEDRETTPSPFLPECGLVKSRGRQRPSPG